MFSFFKEGWFYEKVKFPTDRHHFFTYLSQGLKNGSSIKSLCDSIIDEYYRSNNMGMYKKLDKFLNYTEADGIDYYKAFALSGIVTESEATVMKSISTNEPYKAIDFVNTKRKKEDNMKYAIGMLFFPTLVVLMGYFFFQPQLKEMTIDMLEPVSSISAAPIPIPAYFENRNVFGAMLLAAILLIIISFMTIKVLREKNPRLLFKYLRLTEREFILNNFEIILSVIQTGRTPIAGVEILAKESSDPSTRFIFNQVFEEMMSGQGNFSSVLGRYLSDRGTVSYLKNGEKNNQYEESIMMVLEYNQEKYDKLVKKLVTFLPLTGEIVMTLILLKPLIDIILVTTVGAMNFTI